MEHIRLYTITSCMECEKAKRLLQQEGIDFYEINVFVHPERQEDLFKYAGEFLVPLLVYNDKVCPKESILNAN
ncbi:glutaredoxin family protein [Guptibacillus algicola]|uniref:glutaredoxin family protein n=1 Tax=Guptibacillus algicola TaxID=225844 RepID=UPI001CD7728B|nr:glutaredoxin family protein [Alkalihalobacillus algicola]MCA0988277.1 glutaredoxin family protein [Alkalihalobacillus algicola]